MSDRHAAASEHASIVPGSGPTATADVHAHTTRSDGVLEPLGARPPGGRGRRPAVLHHRPRQPGGLPRAAARRRVRATALELVPGVEINAVTRGLGLEIPGGELHVLGLERGPGRRGVRGRAGLPARGAHAHGSWRPLERLRDAGIGVDAQVDALDLTA